MPFGSKESIKLSPAGDNDKEREHIGTLDDFEPAGEQFVKTPDKTPSSKPAKKKK